jgi:hypothetical protein
MSVTVQGPSGPAGQVVLETDPVRPTLSTVDRLGGWVSLSPTVRGQGLGDLLRSRWNLDHGVPGKQKGHRENPGGPWPLDRTSDHTRRTMGPNGKIL